MSVDEKPRLREPRGRFRRLTLGLVGALWPSQRQILTREGFIYFWIGLALLSAGLYQQVNLILLVFTLSAGPFLASIFGGRTMLRRLNVQRRVPSYVFSGDPLVIDYTLENGRRWFAALALFIEDSLVPMDRSISGATTVIPRVFFARVASRDRARVRWQCSSPKRGKYQFRDFELGTRSPFGLVEHRVKIALQDQMLVYPKIGQLTRRWFQMQRQSTENRRGQRHDRSAQQVEYHGLRGYRPGDSQRWIHWRTSARKGELMVKEFEQQNEQDLAILIDPWLPRTKTASEQREALEQAISFTATLCLESCRHQGRRLVLGWTGAAPGVRQGPASVKLLHELLEKLAVMRPVSEGGLAELFDVMPPAVLRDALLVIISTRPLNLIEEAERSSRFSGTSARSLLGRALILNSTQGDLAPLFQLAEDSTRDLLEQRLSSAIQERLSTQEQRRRGLSSDDDAAAARRAEGDGGTGS
ncbi:MAG: DUF58 domain-containing protein [Isosphaerales bacterium]